MRSVVDGRVVRSGVAVGLTGLVLALSSPGTASAAAPVVDVECGSSATVPSGTSIQLTLLGLPLGGAVSAGGAGTNVLTAPISRLLGTVCRVVVTVVDPVVAAVPPAVTDPVVSAVAPVAAAVSAAPPVAVPVPGGGSVQLGAGGGAAPAASQAPAPDAGGGSGGTTTGSTAPAGRTVVPGPAAGTGGVTGSVAGGVPGTTLLPSGGSSPAPAPAAPGSAGSGTAGSGALGSSGLLPAGGGRPSIFGSPLLAGYSTSGSAAQFGSLGSIPVATAASQSSVQALDARLGSRPGLVVFVAVLALAAVAGVTVRQWVLRALPALATTTVAPVTKHRHRR
jgi:hypothetical protein